MSRRERGYFMARAETQLELARRAASEKAARAHFLIAGTYFDRAYSGVER